MLIAGFAEAAPKKRTRNQNRVGPYGAGFVGMTSYEADPSENEQSLENILISNGIAIQNMEHDTELDDISYQISFGYRFNRYFAAEVGLAQYGEMVTDSSAELDFDDGAGFVPADASLGFSAGGVLFSALGFLPINDKFEVYGRAGFLFVSADRELSIKAEGQPTLSGSIDGNSQQPVFGVGFGWNINVMYTIRAEYQMIDGLGSDETGSEDADNISLGLIVRF
jgi:hypothetical protein